MKKCRKEAVVVYRVKLPDGTILENDTLKSLYYAAKRELRSFTYDNAVDGFCFASAVIEYGVLITDYNDSFRYPVEEFVNSETVCFLFVSCIKGYMTSFEVEV